MPDHGGISHPRRALISFSWAFSSLSYDPCLSPSGLTSLRLNYRLGSDPRIDFFDSDCTGWFVFYQAWRASSPLTFFVQIRRAHQSGV